MIKKILIANRSEIAIRIMRTAAELGLRTVAIYASEDRFALHRFKADESYLVGDGKKPIAAYLDIAASPTSSALPSWATLEMFFTLAQSERERRIAAPVRRRP